MKWFVDFAGFIHDFTRLFSHLSGGYFFFFSFLSIDLFGVFLLRFMRGRLIRSPTLPPLTWGTIRGIQNHSC